VAISSACPKKEVQHLQDELARLERILGGIKDMRRLPSAVFVIDTAKGTHGCTGGTTPEFQSLLWRIPTVILTRWIFPSLLMMMPFVRFVSCVQKSPDAAVEGRRELEALRKDEEPDQSEPAFELPFANSGPEAAPVLSQPE